MAEDLDGEITIIAATPSWIGSVKVKTTFPADCVDSRLEATINQIGVSPDQRVTNRIHGSFSKLTARVIDGANIPACESKHEIHMNSGVKLDGVTATGTVVGFFTKKDAGVLTHHSTWTHFHISLRDRVFAGHKDSMAILAGSIVFICSG